MLDSIETAIEDIKQGKLVIVVDDEDRENEGRGEVKGGGIGMGLGEGEEDLGYVMKEVIVVMIVE